MLNFALIFIEIICSFWPLILYFWWRRSRLTWTNIYMWVLKTKVFLSYLNQILKSFARLRIASLCWSQCGLWSLQSLFWILYILLTHLCFWLKVYATIACYRRFCSFLRKIVNLEISAVKISITFIN